MDFHKSDKRTFEEIHASIHRNLAEIDRMQKEEEKEMEIEERELQEAEREFIRWQATRQ